MKDVILICNAHLDIVWLWRWEEGAAEALSTFRTAAEFCEEFDGFVFNHNEALLYQWTQEYAPELFVKIRKLVQQGRWHILGGWYLQPDCVMISGESFVRQITAGQRYFRSTFGEAPDIAVNFDSFGHSRGLVQILKKAGYRGYIVCRAGNAEREAGGSDFRWRGLDGSEIIVHYSDENYNTVHGEADAELARWLDRHREESSGMFLWGVGDHGGGPSRKDIRQLHQFAERHPETRLRHGTPEEYFSQLDPEALPLYEKSLTPCSEGCYTSQIRVKQLHRKLENGLLSCEKMLSCACAQGLLEYPARLLQEAWECLMRTQFHDALPGSSIRAVETDTLCQLGHGLDLVSRLKAKAFFALSAGQEPIRQNGSAILVFNPHPFAVDTVVDCEVSLPVQNWNSSCMVPSVFHNGELLPCQMEKESSSFEIDWRKRCVFRASLPAFSMSRFDCLFEEKPSRPLPEPLSAQNTYIFSGERIFARINPRTGLIDDLRTDGRPVLRPGAFRLLVMRDFYNSWGVGFEDFDDACGSFTLMDRESGSRFSGLGDLLAESVRIVEDGPVRTVVEAVLSFGDSRACITYKFPRRVLEIEIELKLVWHEQDRLLKLCVPTFCRNAEFWGQTAFGRLLLDDDGSEQVMHKWCALYDGPQNLAVCLVNEGLHGVNCRNGEMRLSLIRSAGYGMSDLGEKKALIPGRMNDRMDQGERLYRLWLYAGPCEEVFSGIDNTALVKNEALMCLGMNPVCGGQIPLPGPIIDRPGVVLSAFKQTEDGNGYLLRLYESEGCRQHAVLHIFGCRVPLEFSPFELKCLLFDPCRQCCREISLTEEWKC